MIKIFRPRQTGKSTELIKLSAKTGHYILTANRNMADMLVRQAKGMGYNILFPVTVEEYFRQNGFKGSFIKDILIDDADAVLCQVFAQVNIEAITMTYDEDNKALEQESDDEKELIKGHCKCCKHFEYDVVALVDGIPLIVAHEMCNKWGNGCKTQEDGYCFLFEPIEN